MAYGKNRRKLHNGAYYDCPECEGTGVYSPGLDPQYDRPCSECRGEGCLMRSGVLPTDKLTALRSLRGFKTRMWDGRTLYQQEKDRIFRKVHLP